MEMLIVLGILVVVFALAAPRFFGAREKAEKNATKVQILAFQAALDKYRFDTRNYPATEQGLNVLFQKPAESEESSVNGWDGPYMDKAELPKDPWGNPYQYACPAERGSGEFDIWSYGPDGEDNTEDDICSWTVSKDGEGGEGDFASDDSNVDVNVEVGDVSVGGSEDTF
jgi:general secretion pathway protein G